MSPVQDLQDLPVALIEPNLHQPRRYFDEEALQELGRRGRRRGDGPCLASSEVAGGVRSILPRARSLWAASSPRKSPAAPSTRAASCGLTAHLRAI
jgi:hypothetical protein